MDPRPIRLSVVVPVFNEEACLERTIPDLLAQLARTGVRTELLVVNNGSRDRSAQILGRLAARRTDIRVLTFERNRGYGGAIIAGFKEARGEIVGFTCADGEVSAADLVTEFRLFESGEIDLVKGKRIGRADGWRRHLLSFGYHVLVGMLFKVHITDINGYPVLLRRGGLDRIELTKTNWIINVDLLYGARRGGLRICEVDVRHLSRAGGRSHVRWYFPFLFGWQLLRYWRSVRHELPERRPGKAPVAT